MEKDEIKRLLMGKRRSDNEASVNYLLGLLDMMSDEELQAKLGRININSGNIEQYLTEQIDRIKTQHEQSENFTNVNKMFCYGRTGDTIHMHIIPKDLRDLKKKVGDEEFYQFYKDQLEDFLSRLQTIFKNDDTIKTLFAVSPIFFNGNISLAHEDLGFDEITEVDPKNKEDKMSMEQKERFIKMFNPDGDHRRKVYYTSMTREKLLSREYAQIPEDEKTILDD